MSIQPRKTAKEPALKESVRPREERACRKNAGCGNKGFLKWAHLPSFDNLLTVCTLLWHVFCSTALHDGCPWHGSWCKRGGWCGAVGSPGPSHMWERSPGRRKERQTAAKPGGWLRAKRASNRTGRRCCGRVGWWLARAAARCRKARANRPLLAWRMEPVRARARRVCRRGSHGPAPRPVDGRVVQEAAGMGQWLAHPFLGRTRSRTILPAAQYKPLKGETLGTRLVRERVRRGLKQLRRQAQPVTNRKRAGALRTRLAARRASGGEAPARTQEPVSRRRRQSVGSPAMPAGGTAIAGLASAGAAPVAVQVQAPSAGPLARPEPNLAARAVRAEAETASTTGMAEGFAMAAKSQSGAGMRIDAGGKRSTANRKRFHNPPNPGKPDIQRNGKRERRLFTKRGPERDGKQCTE